MADVNALLGCGFGKIKAVGWRAGENGRTEILHDHQLLLGVAAGHRNDRGADFLGAVMGAETAGKEAITVSIVNDIAAMGSCGNE